MWNDMSIMHSLPNGLLVICDECKMYHVPYDSEPCKTCLANQKCSLDKDVPLRCFFENKNPEEYNKLAIFIDEHKETIRELYRDSIALGVPMSKLASLWQYRDVLRKYCGDVPPIDIFKEASVAGVPMENFQFQLRRNIRLLTGRAPYATESERREKG